jgi:lysophospholipase L1-like esterase
MAPTTILVWIGNNDALRPAILGDPSLLTPAQDFNKSFGELMSRLARTGATLVVANIPDISSIPFFVTAEEVAAFAGAPLSFVGPILGIRSGDFVTLDALPLAFATLANPALGPLPDASVLTAVEMAKIRAAVHLYNGIIAAHAFARGAALVNIHGLTAEIDRKGYVVNGQRLTTGFLGGIFSLDGIHPTFTGHAIVANAFIDALNWRFGAGIPYVPVAKVASTDPLVPKGVVQSSMAAPEFISSR